MLILRSRKNKHIEKFSRKVILRFVFEALMIKEFSMDRVEIYTDGACSGNPGPGGWGAILIYKSIEKELSGNESHTTNNRMELTGPIKALETLKRPCEVVIYTDSAYCVRHLLIIGLTNGKRITGKLVKRHLLRIKICGSG